VDRLLYAGIRFQRGGKFSFSLSLGDSMLVTLTRFIEDEDGQGITEYGAMLAFVAILVALVFGITHGTLRGAVCAAFSSVTSQLNNMSAGASNSNS
jgi:Flp pilus assembly pilin Flp